MLPKKLTQIQLKPEDKEEVHPYIDSVLASSSSLALQ